MPNVRKLKVFVCYAKEDVPFARHLYDQLILEAWLDPWIDEDKLLAGQDWNMEIEQAVEGADTIIVCLSNISVTKEGYIQKELRNVLDIADEKPEGTIYVIPLRLDDCQVPRRLRAWQYVNYFPESRRKLAYENLLKSLKVKAEAISNQQIKQKRQSKALMPRLSTTKNESSFAPKSSANQSTSWRRTPSGTFSPLASPRLAGMGFHYDPFSIAEAEKLPLDVLEDTYVTHLGFEEIIMDLIRSTILLAPHGAGKTAGRLRLAAILEKKQQESVRDLEKANMSSIPLIIHYDNFEKIVNQLPAIDLTHHKIPLLESIAASFLDFILSYSDLFMKLDQKLRDFWLVFLSEYIDRADLEFRLTGSHMINDWQRISNHHLSPFRPDAGLLEILQVLKGRFEYLHVQPVYILVDGLDGYLETQEPVNLEGLVLPLLNTLELFSSSGIVWKFFFPDSLKDFVRSRSHGYRTGRLEILPISWDENSLGDFLHQRLLWASEGRILDITQNCEQDLIMKVGNIDIELAKMALRHSRLGPPRALLQLADQLHKCGIQPQLTLADWEYFLGSIQSEIP